MAVARWTALLSFYWFDPCSGQRCGSLDWLDGRTGSTACRFIECVYYRRWLCDLFLPTRCRTSQPSSHWMDVDRVRGPERIHFPVEPQDSARCFSSDADAHS